MRGKLDSAFEPSAGELSAPYGAKQQENLTKRFDYLTNLLGYGGTLAGTAHKRIVIPKDVLSERDIHQLGFVPVKLAIPEAGQDRLESFRHPTNLYHIHSHPEGWTMHADEHPAATMLARAAHTPAKKVKAFAGGVPHAKDEGLPGLYYYLRGRLKGHKSTAQQVLSELPTEILQAVQSMPKAFGFQDKGQKKTADGSFATSQYSGPIGHLHVNYRSGNLPITQPVLKMDTKTAALLPVFKQASIVSPMGQLRKAQAVGAPGVPAAPGPSIAQQSKPVGFGVPMSGAVGAGAIGGGSKTLGV